MSKMAKARKVVKTFCSPTLQNVGVVMKNETRCAQRHSKVSEAAVQNVQVHKVHITKIVEVNRCPKYTNGCPECLTKPIIVMLKGSPKSPEWPVASGRRRHFHFCAIVRKTPGDTPRCFLNTVQRCRSLANPQLSATAFSGSVELISKSPALSSRTLMRNSLIPVP